MSACFDLDVVIPTFNRPELLLLTLTSFRKAICPEGLRLKIIVVDNNSSIENSELNKAACAHFPELDVAYVLEQRQGRSFALNRGIAESTSAFLGFIDDDEEVDSRWLQVVFHHISKNDFDFIGGPYKPNWQSPPPDWLPVHIGSYKGVLGWIEQSETMRPFEDFGGTLVGGNAIIRRSTIEKTGGFSTELGRSGKNLMGGEDEEFHRRLDSIGAKGIYDPELIIFHLIPTTRMSKKYHLRWAFWSGVSNGRRSNWEDREAVPYLFGIPRYRYSKAASGLSVYIRSLIHPRKYESPKAFTGLMDSLYFSGMVYGKLFY
jgi:glucosyl-dolichyl phosphate glucuronosyltransferase